MIRLLALVCIASVISYGIAQALHPEWWGSLIIGTSVALVALYIDDRMERG